MSRWRWWVVLIFLPPVALLIVWRDKKFLKQMALAIFYASTLISLAGLFAYAYSSSVYGSGMPWEVYTRGVMPWVGVMLFGLLLAAYAQHKIIKVEERIRDGADP